jgi:hypothetical protein
MEKSESKIQQEIVMFYRNNFCRNGNAMIFSVPNEGRDPKEQMAKKATGLLSGVSDLIIVTKFETIFVEVKDATGTQKPQQKVFAKVMRNLGKRYLLVRSLEDFKEQMGIEPQNAGL